MLKKILLSGVALVPIGLARLGFNAFAVRWFGEEVSGELNLALSLGLALALPVSAAFGPSVLRFVAYARGQGRHEAAGWLLWRLLLGALAFEAVVALAALLARDLLPGAADIATPLFLVALAVGLSYAAYLVLRNGLYAVDRVATYTALELAAAVVFFAGLVTLGLTAPPWALLASFVAGYSAFCLAALAALKPHLHTRRPQEEAVPRRDVVRFAGIASVATTASMGLREVATVLTPTLAGLEGTAFIALALAALAPMHFLPRTLRSLLFAASAEHAGRGDDDALARGFSEVSHQLALLNLPIVALVAIGARPLLALTGVDVDDQRVLVFRLLCLAGLLDIVASTAANALAGLGRVGVNAVASLAGLAVASAVWLALPQWGLTSVAGGYLAAAAVRAAIPIVTAARDHQVRFTRAWPRLLVLTVTAGAALLLEARSGPWIPSLAFGAVAAAAVWPSLTMLRDRVRRRGSRA